MLIIQLIIIQVMTFAALVFVLRKIMYSASFGETKRLQQLNQENAKKTQELANKIEEAEKQYQEKLAHAEDEVKKLKSQANEEVNKLKEEALSKAKQESERIVNQALNTKEKLKEEIASQMKEKSVEQSLRLIQDVLSLKNQTLVHEGLIDDVIEEIEKLEQGRLQARTDKGELITPHAIDKSRKEKIKAVLSKKTGKKIALEEKIDKEVIAGITIKLGSLVIDGSLAGKLKEAVEAVKKG